MWDILNLPIGRRGSLIDRIIWLANSIVFAIQPLLTPVVWTWWATAALAQPGEARIHASRTQPSSTPTAHFERTSAQNLEKKGSQEYMIQPTVFDRTSPAQLMRTKNCICNYSAVNCLKKKRVPACWIS